MTERKPPTDGKEPPPVIPEGLGREATLLLKYFWALSLKNQRLAVKLLQALLKTQGTLPPE